MSCSELQNRHIHAMSMLHESCEHLLDCVGMIMAADINAHEHLAIMLGIKHLLSTGNLSCKQGIASDRRNSTKVNIIKRLWEKFVIQLQ